MAAPPTTSAAPMDDEPGKKLRFWQLCLWIPNFACTVSRERPFWQIHLRTVMLVLFLTALCGLPILNYFRELADEAGQWTYNETVPFCIAATLLTGLLMFAAYSCEWSLRLREVRKP